MICLREVDALNASVCVEQKTSVSRFCALIVNCVPFDKYFAKVLQIPVGVVSRRG